VITLTTLSLRTLLVAVTELDAALKFYTETLGLPVKFRDGNRYAALDAGGCTLALVTAADHPAPEHGVVPAFKTDDVSAAVRDLAARGAEVLDPPREGPHEVRALLRDPAGNPVSVYGPPAGGR